MGKYVFRIYHDTCREGALATVSGCIRVIYCVSGGAELTMEGNRFALAPDEAWHGTGELTIRATAPDTELWRWELLRTENAFEGKITGRGIDSSDAGTYTLEMDPEFPRLVRCDKVSFPPGGIAYHHIHAGPGVRSLLTGALYVDMDGKRWQGTTRSTWFEIGPGECYAKAVSDVPATFVRVMILPRSYEGKPSITYVRPEEQGLPSSREYHRYFDEFVEI